MNVLSADGVCGPFPFPWIELILITGENYYCVQNKSKYYKITTNLHEFSFRRDVNTALEDGTNTLSRNVGTKLPLYAASIPPQKKRRSHNKPDFVILTKSPFPTTQPEDCALFVDNKLPFRSLTRNYNTCGLQGEFITM